MTILGPATASYETVLANLPAAAEGTFTDVVFPLLWKVAGDRNVNPHGMTALVGKETGWWGFDGNVRPEFNNPGGLKLADPQRRLFPGVTDGDNPLGHAMFPSIEAGLIAVAEHLHAHCGIPPNTVLRDYRYQLVLGIYADNPAVTWSDLNGRWSPSATYGDEIEASMGRLAGGG